MNIKLTNASLLRVALFAAISGLGTMSVVNAASSPLISSTTPDTTSGSANYAACQATTTSTPSNFNSQNVIAGYTPPEWCTELYQAIYNLGGTMAGNILFGQYYLGPTPPPPASSGTTSSTSSSSSTASATPPPSYLIYANPQATVTAAAQPATLQGVITTLTTADPATAAVAFQTAVQAPLTAVANSAQAAANQASMNFDINSLLGPLQYVSPPGPPAAKSTTPTLTGDQAAAYNFITAVSGLNSPYPVINLSSYTPAQISNALTTPAGNFAAYVGMLQTYTAQVAVGLGNLYRYYQERIPSVPVSGSSSQIVLPSDVQSLPGLPQNATNASPLLVKQYEATWRLTDPGWYPQMQSASPAQVERQMVLLLAEMRAAMFEQTEEIKRLNATMSVLVLQNANNSRIFITTAASKAKADFSN